MYDEANNEHTFFWHTLEQFGHHVALLGEDDSSISYAALAAMADNAGFAEQPRQLVLLELSNHVDAIAAYIGALRAGHAVILTNAGNAESADKLQQQFRPSLRWSAGHLATFPDMMGVELHPDLAVMLSTSGSTGSAKLVRLSAEAVDANARSIAEYLDISSDDRAITSLPPAYSYGLSVINSHLLVGAGLVLTDQSVIDPSFRALMDRHAVTSIACVPYTVDLLESSGFLANIPVSLQTITQAGGRLAPEKVLEVGRIAEETNIRFFVMYGQTEATARIAWLPPHLRDTNPDCIGRAIPGGRLWLKDPDTGQEDAERGELVYTGPNVMLGYAESTADLARGREVFDLATGDLAERTTSDLFRITGRRSRFVKIFGLRIALDEIENQLRAQSVDATVAGSDDRIVVAIRGAIPAGFAAADIAARYKLPEDRIGVVSVKDLPRLENGKVDYRTILDLVQPATRAAGRRPFDDFEKLLKQKANGRPIDPAASFSSLRSDSLSFVEASILLERSLGDLPPDWQTLPIGTLREMAKSAEQRLGALKVAFSPDILIRVVAIALIIIAHGLGSANTFLKGGADVMIVLAGYNLARYNGAHLFAGKTLSVMLDPLRRVVPLMFPLMLIYSLWRHTLPWYYWFFIQNYFVDSYLTMYWFLSAWVQCTLLMVVLFSIPAVRAWFARDILRASITLLCLAFALKFIAYSWSVPAAHRFREFEQIFLFFMTGWCFFFIKKPSTFVAVILAVTAASVISWGKFNTHPVIMIAALSALAFAPKLRLPLVLAKPVQVVVLSSLHIYIIGVIPSLLLFKLGEFHGKKQLLFTAGHFVATFVLGVGVWWSLRLLADLWHAARSKLRARRLEHPHAMPTDAVPAE